MEIALIRGRPMDEERTFFEPFAVFSQPVG